MRKVSYVLPLIVLAIAGICGVATASDIAVINQSDWALDNFYLSPVGQNEWGPDQLGEDIVSSGENFLLKGVPCDSYDVKLVDEDGDECILGGVNVCAENQGWIIDSKDLVTCQAATDEAQEEDEQEEDEDDEDEEEDEDDD